MKTLIRIEEAALFILSYIFTIKIGYDWWMFLLLLLTPDISMIGYAFGTKSGAWLYDLFHHKALAIIIVLIGFTTNLPVAMLIGLVLFGHSSMDRVFGYGLKYTDDFKHTHLGWLPQGKSKN